MNIFDILIIAPMVNLVLFLYALIPGGSFGLSIILFTLIIRFLLYPLIKKNLHNSRKMQKLQPELRALNKKYNGKTKEHRQAKAFAMMELYKKHDINTFGSIGIMLLQLPILFGLYHVVLIFSSQRDQLEKYSYEWLQHVTPGIKELLSNTAGLNNTFFNIADLSNHAISKNGVEIIFVIFVVIAAVSQFLMMRQTMPKQEGEQRRLRDIMKEASEGKEVDQSEINAITMRRMMLIMPFMFLFIGLFFFPGGLALYMMVSGLTQLVQQYWILGGDKKELETLSSQPKKDTKKIVEATVVSTKNAHKKVKKQFLKTEKDGVKITRISAKDK